MDPPKSNCFPSRVNISLWNISLWPSSLYDCDVAGKKALVIKCKGKELHGDLIVDKGASFCFLCSATSSQYDPQHIYANTSIFMVIEALQLRIYFGAGSSGKLVYEGASFGKLYHHPETSHTQSDFC